MSVYQTLVPGSLCLRCLSSGAKALVRDYRNCPRIWSLTVEELIISGLLVVLCFDSSWHRYLSAPRRDYVTNVKLVSILAALTIKTFQHFSPVLLPKIYLNSTCSLLKFLRLESSQWWQ